jgi:hypothetical protein
MTPNPRSGPERLTPSPTPIERLSALSAQRQPCICGAPLFALAICHASWCPRGGAPLVTFWLYHSGRVITAVRAPANALASDVRKLAAIWADRAPYYSPDLSSSDIKALAPFCSVKGGV